MSEKPIAFVIMPFGSEFLDIFQTLIASPLEEIGYVVHRADTNLNQRSILADIIEGINDASLIIADLTTINANVMYELGISHAFKKPVIMVTQSIDDIPFDLRMYRTLLYSTDFREIQEFKSQLTEIATKVCGGTCKFGNPVSDYLAASVQKATFSSAGNITDSSDELVQQAAVIDEDEQESENGLLDLLADGAEALHNVSLTMNKLTERTRTIGENVRKYDTQFRTLSADEAKFGKAREMQNVMKAMAADMQEYAGALNKDHETLSDGFRKIIDLYSFMVELIGSDNLPVEQKSTLQDQLQTLYTSTHATIKQVGGFRDQVARLAEMRMSKDISSASRIMRRNLDTILADFAMLESFCVNGLRQLGISASEE